MTTKTVAISNSHDVIDSRDVIARIEELETERQSLVDARDEAISASDKPEIDLEVDSALADIKVWDDDYGDELKALQALADETIDDWRYGATLIRESYFVDYCEEMVKDIGDMPQEIPAYIAIDWEQTADNIRVDYTEVDFGGVTYLVR